MDIYAFGARTLLMLLIPVALAVVILAVVGRRGTSVFKKQGVAWGLTLLMVFAAVGIGYAKAPQNLYPSKPDHPSQTIAPGASEPGLPAGSSSFVWDNARVLSDQEVRTLNSRNDRLWDNYNVTIGVVTCNYGGDDLYSYAFQCTEDMGLGGYDMIVVLDIQGDNYYLLQGNDIRWDFTDNDCSNYAYEYMEYKFARGFYGDALLDLTEALEIWYGNYFG